MKTLLIQVNKTTDKHFAASISDYIKRISHYMPIEITTIGDIKNSRNLTEELQKTIEGEMILKQVRNTDKLVLLDEHGIEFTSIKFASWLEHQRNNTRRLVFAIGGPYGFSQQIYDRANEQISLSQMTFSHQMVRLIFTEQLYRACTIIKGDPYHHE